VLGRDLGRCPCVFAHSFIGISGFIKFYPWDARIRDRSNTVLAAEKLRKHKLIKV
jgi:hypothetical protein